MRGTKLRVFRNIGNQFARPRNQEIEEMYKWKNASSFSLSLFLVLSFFLFVKSIFCFWFSLSFIVAIFALELAITLGDGMQSVASTVSKASSTRLLLPLFRVSSNVFSST